MSLGLRANAGHGVWAVIAFLFPVVATVHDDSVILAILLFVLETLLASAVLLVRTLGRRGGSDDDHGRRRLHEARRVLQLFVAPFSLGCIFMFATVALIEYSKGRLPVEGVGLLRERASWMAGMLLASALLDTLIAPVRSVQWLETAIAWQSSRTAVMTVVLMLGWPVMLFTGSSHGFFWVFFTLRLLSDAGSLRGSERERIRERMFGSPYVPGAQASAVAGAATAPPRFSTAHARHDVNDPRRPPE